MPEKRSQQMIIDPLTILSKNYDSDLRVLRNLRPVTITPLDVSVLRSMVIKYCTTDNENLCDMMKYRDDMLKKQFFLVKGELEGEIQQRLESLTKIDYLESVRDRMPSKRPRQPTQRISTVTREVDE